MAHYSRLSKVVIDVPPADHDRELAFRSAAAGQPLTRFGRHPEYHGAALHGQEFWLLIQQLGQGSARVHIDVHTDDNQVPDVEWLALLTEPAATKSPVTLLRSARGCSARRRYLDR